MKVLKAESRATQIQSPSALFYEDTKKRQIV